MHTIHERRGRMMGSDLHLVVVDGDDDLLDRAIARLAGLEARWSRFRDDSEISLMNAADGNPVLVSPDTMTLVDGLRNAWHLTDGRFDPTVHDAVLSAGYDASWPDVRTPDHLDAAPALGCWGMSIRPDLGFVQLPVGLHLDPGGLGKGLAADIVATELLGHGAAGALVSLGGDLRVVGTPPDDEAWTIDVEHPDDRTRIIATVRLADGGIATSTSAKRQWRTARGEVVHHIIDPLTGLPAIRPWRQVTAVAGTAAWAEVAAKTAFLDGRPSDPISSVLLVGADGDCWTEHDGSWFELHTQEVPR